MTSRVAAAEGSRTTNPSWRVSVAVADLRKEPVKPALNLDHDPLEESQLLYGDPVRIEEEKGGWVRVAALEQPEWSHHQRWEGYPGWMERACLSPEPPGWTPNLVVTTKSCSLFEKPDSTTPLRMTFSLGTRLKGTLTKGWWELDLLDGTTGWIQGKEATSLEELALLRQEPQAWRARLVETARLFLGDPYYWGGRSAPLPAVVGLPQTAMDCSGLVGLAYQANGMILPRDAHEIWMRALPISPEQLLLGDLLFLHDLQDPQRVTHVLLVSRKASATPEDDWVIEGPGTGKPIHEIPLKEKLQTEKGRRVSFGTYLP